MVASAWWVSLTKPLLSPAFVLPAWDEMWGESEVRVCLVEAGFYCLCLGAAPRPRADRGRGRQMFHEKWFLHHLVSSFLVMVRSVTNQQLQAEYFTSNEAPSKEGF